MPTKRALIVDDSTTAQYRLKKMLRSYDLQIDAVDSGEAALLHLASHVPDVIFMDHLMPGMDGFRALQIIKSHPETAMVPVIMYTSKSGDVYTGQARALGALDVISKDSINATDLSKVMEGIHIYPKNKQALAAETAYEPLEDDNINPQLDISDLSPIEEVATPASRTEGASSDNSRRIELRISQLEHAIDDSRRVITARLVREIQKLRYNISRELIENLPSNATKSAEKTPAADEMPLPVLIEPPRPSRMLPFATLLVVLLVGGLSLKYFNQLNEQLAAMGEQQAEQRTHLTDITNQLLELHTSLEMQSNMQTQLGIINSGKVVKNTLLNDLVWAFNQNGVMPFTPEIMDPTAIQRLNEFVDRISQQGFKGAVWVNLNAGDFCVVTDSSGRVQLPAKDTRMSDCVLLSELYRIENLLDEAVEEIDTTLISLNSVSRGDINVIVSRMDGQLLKYPNRQPQTLASEWNKIAQNNNRLTIELSDVDSLQ